jgi:sec-independent protein translocase protein TatA
MFGLGTSELIIVAVVALLLFGSNLPNVAKTFGKTYGDFRRSLSDLQDQFRIPDHTPTRTARSNGNASGGSKLSSSIASSDEPSKEPSAPKFTPPPAEDAANG